MGYKQAGFDVTGIDIEPQPKYPFKFILSDAITYLKEHGKEYDFIHASPPCQGYSHLTPKEHKGNYEKQIDVLRELLKEKKKQNRIEKITKEKNELKNPTMLCGSMFKLRTQRHRFFETSFPLVAPCNCDHSEIPLLVTTASKASREKRFALGMQPKTVKNAPLAYGIDWMDFKGLREAIPPAYTKYIGEVWLSLHCT